MRYQGNVFRPPSEAGSLILQATLGCSYNRCAFCAMYRDSAFRVRPLEELAEDIREARALYGPAVRRVFLADGDALILKSARLHAILDLLEEAFPELNRVGAYATPQSLLRKSVDELRSLKARRLSILYLGVESGSERVLERIRKGVTRAQMIEAGRKAVEAGMKLSTMIILGAGGPEQMPAHSGAF